MVRDIKYIIKRIIIGVGIAIIMMLLRGSLLLSVSAKEISSVNTGGLQASFSNTTSGQALYFGPYWNNWGPGYLHFGFSVVKSSGSSTSQVPFVRYAQAITGDGQFYYCDIGSVDSGNSTYHAVTYSATCPMTVGSGGITQVYVRFADTSNLDTYTANLFITGVMTYEQADSTTVNVDMNSVNNKIQQQINNDNYNTDRIINSQNNTTNAVDNVNDTLNDDDITGANTEGSSFFNTFQSNTHGLSGIITAPLRLLNNLSSSTCSPLTFPLPIVHNSVTLPCMSSIYSLYPTFWNIWKIITDGLIGYWVVIKIFGKVKDFQNPNNDKVEVLEL